MEKELSEKELKLIEKLRKIQFGEVKIMMQNGQPYRIIKIEQSELIS